MRHVLVAVLAGGAVLLTGAPALAGTTTLGPYGYGDVRLGMSLKQARATGKIVPRWGARTGSCSAWALKSRPTRKGTAGLYISRKRGVAVIFAPKGVKTPEGIGVGSTMKQVKRAYPRLRFSAGGIPNVSVPGNRKAYYAFFPDEKGRLEQLSLGLLTQDCVS
ncbi:hypothetical protein [Nonomuraea zeae]|uniref:Uncharacterized protein n=1 Tax=Nonomuraea zeae TaxID=1642303 RepID=A0A5S4GMW6_9ACTN|nr:hypothetical protein [Nonomuraea zeae]TMR34149.1 hypothetical protein ETD85_17760 [Nonomuraea zeae]